MHEWPLYPSFSRVSPEFVGLLLELENARGYMEIKVVVNQYKSHRSE